MYKRQLVAHAGQTEEEDTKQFGVKKGREQSGGTLEIGQYLIHYIEPVSYTHLEENGCRDASSITYLLSTYFSH